MQGNGIEVGGLEIDGLRSPFGVNLAPHVPYRVAEPQILEIEPPRKVYLGNRIDPNTGYEVEPYFLPLPDCVKDVELIACKGDRGAGKSNFTKLMIDYWVEEGRDVIIIEPKKQYLGLHFSNTNKKQIEILKTFGVSPKRIENVRCLIPINQIQELREYGEKYFNDILEIEGAIEKDAKMPYIPLNVKTKNLTAEAFFGLSSQAQKDRTYILYLEALLYSLKKNNCLTTANLKKELDLLAEIKTKSRSILAISNSLEPLSMMKTIDDDGVDAKELLTPASPRRKGSVFVISMFGGTQNQQSLAILCDFLVGLRDAIIDNRNLKPCLVIEEADELLGDASHPMIKNIVKKLALVYGRSGRLSIILVFQLPSQVPSELLSMSTSIMASFHKTMNLGEYVQPLSGIGYARFELRNMGFLSDRIDFVHCMPSPFLDVD